MIKVLSKGKDFILIETFVILKDNNRNKMQFPIRKDTVLIDLEEENRCGILFEGHNFIISADYNELNNLKKEINNG